MRIPGAIGEPAINPDTTLDHKHYLRIMWDVEEVLGRIGLTALGLMLGVREPSEEAGLCPSVINIKDFSMEQFQELQAREPPGSLVYTGWSCPHLGLTPTKWKHKFTMKEGHPRLLFWKYGAAIQRMKLQDRDALLRPLRGKTLVTDAKRNEWDHTYMLAALVGEMEWQKQFQPAQPSEPAHPPPAGSKQTFPPKPPGMHSQYPGRRPPSASGGSSSSQATPTARATSAKPRVVQVAKAAAVVAATKAETKAEAAVVPVAVFSPLEVQVVLPGPQEIHLQWSQPYIASFIKLSLIHI